MSLLPSEIKTEYLKFERIEDGEEGLAQYRVSVLTNPDMSFVLTGIRDVYDLRVYTDTLAK